MSCPIVLVLEGIAAERAFEDAVFRIGLFAWDAGLSRFLRDARTL